MKITYGYTGRRSGDWWIQTSDGKRAEGTWHASRSGLSAPGSNDTDLPDEEIEQILDKCDFWQGAGDYNAVWDGQTLTVEI